MSKMKKWLPVLLLAAGLAMSLPLAAQSQCGGGGGGGGGHMDHSNMGSSGMMGNTGNMGMGSSRQRGQGTMGPGMMGGTNAPAGTWSQPAGPGPAAPGRGTAPPVDHSQMGHGGPGTGQ